MLPATIPIFPLPNVVLFPDVFLPLHIFEPRYRAMVADALPGDRIIGMTLLRPGWEEDYEGRPAVYPLGCAGVITHAEPLADGRYDIILRGLEKFRILGENEHRSYRLAHIEALPETAGARERAALRRERDRLEGLIVSCMGKSSHDCRVPGTVPDEELVNALAQYLRLEPLEKQALLECDGVVARCRSLIELLEMKAFATQAPWGATGIH
jgi:Lon protease-like protein